MYADVSKQTFDKDEKPGDPLLFCLLASGESLPTERNNIFPIILAEVVHVDSVAYTSTINKMMFSISYPVYNVNYHVYIPNIITTMTNGVGDIKHAW